MTKQINKIFVLSVKGNYSDIGSRLDDLDLPYQVSYEVIDGIIGKETNMEYNEYPWALTEMNPWNEWWERPMLDGEVGCALGHYNMWKQAYDEGHEVCMFLEEDFEGVRSLSDLGMIPDDIDGLYLGRRRVPNHEWLYDKPEERYNDNWVYPQYSYNAHAYILTREGLRKLLYDYNLIDNLMPLDEFLISTINLHPRQDIREFVKPTLKFIAPPTDDDNWIAQTSMDIESGNEYGTSLTEDITRLERSIKFDMVYIITLDTSNENYEKLTNRLEELGLPNDVPIRMWRGTNGKEEFDTIEKREQMGIKFYDGWKVDSENNWWTRPVTVGEAGGVHSHIRIWEDVVEREYNNVLILEDDFNPKQKFHWNTFDELKDYDLYLIFLSRLLIKGNDTNVGLESWVKPSYSYQTLCYVLNYDGAKKLVETNVPILKQNIIVSDEFLPATYTTHPREDIRKMFIQNMNVLAFKSNPVLQDRYEAANNSQTSPIEGIDFN